MSLDVYLSMKGATRKPGSGIYVRECGCTRQITREEWDYRFPGCDPVVAVEPEEVVLDDTVYSANITHNLNEMADAAGIYKHLWRPEELGITHARQLVEPLREGLARLRADPKRFEQYNASNGWGLYKNFVPFVARYLEACEQWPDAEVSVSR